VCVLATDIKRAALERARRGHYGTWSFREVPAHLAAAYFVRRDAAVEVAGHIREAVDFAYLNLAEDRWPSVVTQTVDLDLVLCRNVLLYFGDELTRRVAAKLHGALADGGWLLVAPAEPSPDVFHPFAVRNLGGAVAYRRAAAPPVAVPPGGGPARRRLARRRLARRRPAGRRPAAARGGPGHAEPSPADAGPPGGGA
jgi:chemotaxis protein methyltransferase CheR